MLFTQFRVQISTVHFEQDLYIYKVLFEMDRTNITLMIYNFFCFVFVQHIIEGYKVVDLTKNITTLKQRIDDMENEQNM